MRQRLLGLLLLVALVDVGGCATTGGNSSDPLEGYNRAMFGFNEGVDKAIVTPVASGYKAVVPEVARTGVINFFSNTGDVWIGINNILQGKVGAGVSDFSRFGMNTTAGILGLIDVASDAGLDKHNEDFGQTLGRWGVGSGPYVVLPILGPSTVRDGLSLLVDWYGNPLRYVGNVPTRNELTGLRLVDTRANLLDASRFIDGAALDHYAYVRDAYLQRRRSLIYDGDPPRESDSDKSSESEDSKVTAARADPELSPVQSTTQLGERVVTTADKEIVPAKEFSEAKTPSITTRQNAAGTTGRASEPGIPYNRDPLQL